MAFCERLSEQLAVVGTIDPQAGLAGLATSDVVDMSLHRRALFTLMTGDTVGGTGILVEIREGQAAFAAPLVLITSAAIAQAVVASQYIFEVSAEAMTDGYIQLRCDITPTGASTVAVLVQADVERYHPGSDRNLATAHIIACAN